MDNQAAFDKALNGVRQQQAFGWDRDNSSCVYLVKDTGVRCAIGLLMTDAWVKRHSSTPKPIDLLFKEGKTPMWVNYGNITFLQELQDVHDRAAGRADFDDFEYQMANLAVEWELQYSKKDQSNGS